MWPRSVSFWLTRPLLMWLCRRPHLNLESILHSIGGFLLFFLHTLIYIFHISFLLRRSVLAVSSGEVKSLEAMKYDGSPLHWADCGGFAKRGERKKKSHICITSTQTQRCDVHESPVSWGIYMLFLFFHAVKPNLNTFTPLLTLVGIEGMFTYHLSPLLAANVVNWVV